MNRAEFDEKYQASFFRMISENSWEEMIAESSRIILEESPDYETRVELLTGIAVAHTNQMNEYLVSQKTAGAELHELLGVTKQESAAVMENLKSLYGVGMGVSGDAKSI